MSLQIEKLLCATDRMMTFTSFVGVAEQESSLEKSCSFADGEITNLCLSGRTGTGKTHLLNAILNYRYKNNLTKNPAVFQSEGWARLASEGSSLKSRKWLEFDLVAFEHIDWFTYESEHLLKALSDLMKRRIPVVVTCDEESSILNEPSLAGIFAQFTFGECDLPSQSQMKVIDLPQVLAELKAVPMKTIEQERLVVWLQERIGDGSK
jgi:chromosomal replication initiation ATPase DnaA